MKRYLRLESALILVVGSRLVLLAAVISNIDKAQWAFGRLSESGTWSTWVLAFALEGALAISSYGLAEEVRRGGRALGLWSFTALFALMSAGANITYFNQHLPVDATSAQQFLAWAFGLAAPTIALANGVLAGLATGQKLEEEDRQEDRSFQVRMAELAVEQARQERLSANAMARAEKARAMAGSLLEDPAGFPEPTRKQLENWQTFLKAHPDMLDMTGKQIAELAGVSERTGNNWKQYARAAGNGGHA